MEITEIDKPEPQFRQPTEKMRRLWFDNDEDQQCFQAIYSSMVLCESLHNDIRVMFVQARLIKKLEDFSVPAPNDAPLLQGMRRERVLPPYPGHPISIDLSLAEMTLVEVALQVVPWNDSGKRLAARAYEFMLNSELVEVNPLEEMSRQLEDAYKKGRLVDQEGKVIK